MTLPAPTAAAQAPITAAPAARPREISRRSRARKNNLFVGVCIAATTVSVIVLVVLIAAIVVQGWEYLSWDFFRNFPSRKPEKAGIKAALWGSVWVTTVAAIVAVPLGVATAIILEEFPPRNRILRKLHWFVQLNVGNLAGVPSIVYGILGLTVFVRMFGVFGSPNTALYDEMLRVKLNTGEVIQADLSEETDDAYTLDHPVLGTLTYPKSEIRDVTRIFVKTHHFTLADGTRHSGRLDDSENGRISMTTADGRDVSFAAADVVSYDSTNFIQYGDPDSFFYIRIPFGGSVLAGGLTLALVILPIIIIAAREAIRAVPDSIRQGAFALGATRWRVVSRTVLPASIPGILTGSILAVSRAIGEAAPLLVVGGFVFITFVPRNLMDDFAAMPLQIFNWASRPQEEFHKVAASGILVLLGVLLAFNAVAIVLRQKLSKPLQ